MGREVPRESHGQTALAGGISVRPWITPKVEATIFPASGDRLAADA